MIYSLVMNASDAAVELGVDGIGLNTLWRKIPKKDIVRLGRDFYCGKIMCSDEDEDDFIYVVNGFFLALRNTYINPNAKLTWLSVKLPTFLSWENFRTDVRVSLVFQKNNCHTLVSLSFFPFACDFDSGLSDSHRSIWSPIPPSPPFPFPRFWFDILKYDSNQNID